MKYNIEITGGLTGIKTVLEGELTAQDQKLERLLLDEKKVVSLNPNASVGYQYKINLEKGRRNKREYLYDETTLTDSFKELLELAKAESKVY